jgi:AcrR family transcriptional regulator
MQKTSIKARVPLDREAWILAATDVLADEGLSGLRVEVLAKNLRVTKGSFYWHFKDRNDLLQSVLLSWKEGRIRDIQKATRSVPGAELEHLHHIVDLYSASRSRRGMLIELAVREWAQRDPGAAAIVGEVDTLRLRSSRELFLACGLPLQEATSRSLLLYAYVFGSSLMLQDGYGEDLPRIKREIAELVVGARPPGG